MGLKLGPAWESFWTLHGSQSQLGPTWISIWPLTPSFMSLSKDMHASSNHVHCRTEQALFQGLEKTAIQVPSENSMEMDILSRALPWALGPMRLSPLDPCMELNLNSAWNLVWTMQGNNLGPA